MLPINDSMDENAISRDKARELTDETHYLGTDAGGNDHYLLSIENIVWVENEQGQIGGIQHIPALSAYVDKVEDIVGWEEHTYDARSMGEWLDNIMSELEFERASEVRA